MILTHFWPLFHLRISQVVCFYWQNVWKTPMEQFISFFWRFACVRNKWALNVYHKAPSWHQGHSSCKTWAEVWLTNFCVLTKWTTLKHLENEDCNSGLHIVHEPKNKCNYNWMGFGMYPESSITGGMEFRFPYYSIGRG